MNEILIQTIGIFFVTSLVNVILNTMKTFLTVRGTTFSAANINAVTFGFYTLVLKQIADVDLIISVPIIMITNYIGVYLAAYIYNKTKKDKLWRISVTIPTKKGIDTGEITTYLKKYNIEYVLTNYEGGFLIDIFSKTQGESSLIKEIITNAKINYTIYEIEKTL